MSEDTAHYEDPTVTIARLREELIRQGDVFRAAEKSYEAELARLSEGQTNVGYWYREAARLREEVARLREENKSKGIAWDLEVRTLKKELARLREEYEDLCVECSTSVSNMEQRAEKAEKELARLREASDQYTPQLYLAALDENARLREALERVESIYGAYDSTEKEARTMRDIARNALKETT